MNPPTPAALPARLTVVCGPMFAGKTSELLRRYRRSAPPRALITPVRDTRSGAHARAHTGDAEPSLPLDDAANLLPALRSAFPAALPALVAIDEAHFFGASLVAPVRALLAAHTSVLVAGLERDHRGEPFAPLPELLAEADEVVKLSCPCARCGAPAIHSQRMSASRERIVVGGAGDYQPRCRNCFEPGA
ncbi:MAG: thymidine kinase [Planctomycetota bacterium]|nr:thymidine kinase [Planctomycetota bacterium]